MKKEIEIILQDKSWDKLFDAIFNEQLYDYKKYILKLYLEEDTIFNQEKIKL
ncbi:MAG: hypothetical protein Q8S84_01315 [bacterium]|nr:hypothetical protein [bacterium]MDP3380212.1 hypothetical protein [bacterium]